MRTPMESPEPGGAGDPAGVTRRKFVAAASAAVAVAGTGAGTAGAVPAAGVDGAAAAAGGSVEQGARRGQWLAGDTHVHDDHSSDGSLPRQTSKQTQPGNLPVGDQIGQGV